MVYEEIKKGLQSGIDAYNQGIEMKRTTITTDDSSNTDNVGNDTARDNDTATV